LSKKGGVSPNSSSRDSAAAFLDQVQATIESHGMIAAGDLVLVAVSGGPDSAALLHVLDSLRTKFRFRLRAAHVHHGIRGTDADADARAAATLAQSLGIPFSRHRADVPNYAETHGLSLEAAAREVRYQWLESIANRYRANRIATGHTADDQAETILLNLLRGTGPRGLAGIHPVRGRLVRPLISISRSHVENYCKHHRISFRVDRSNFDSTFTRNRIRHEALPALQKIQPAVATNLARLAAIMRAEDEFMAEQADNALRGVASQRPGEVGIILSLFGALAPALQRRVLRAAVARVKGDELDIGLERIDALVHLAVSGRTGATIELPGGLRAERTYGEVVIAPTPSGKDVSTQEWTLSVPGEITIRELGIELRARRSRAKTPPPNPMSALVDVSKIDIPLTVRTRRRGDRFRPLGMKGTVKLQDFFVNAKVSRSDRDRVPLVLSGDKIIWVVGYRINESVKTSGKTRRSIRLDVHRLTG